MKNFNKRDSHGHHGSKHPELVKHAHSHGLHAFTHILYINTVTTTWCVAPAQLLFFSACWVFLCFRNPPNFDMDYRIFIMHTWSFLCVRVHMEVGHTDSESAHFGLTFFLCSRWDSNLHPLDPSPMLYQLSHPITHTHTHTCMHTHTRIHTAHATPAHKNTVNWIHTSYARS